MLKYIQKRCENCGKKVGAEHYVSLTSFSLLCKECMGKHEIRKD